MGERVSVVSRIEGEEVLPRSRLNSSFDGWLIGVLVSSPRL